MAAQTPNMVTMMKQKQITPQIPELPPIAQEEVKEKVTIINGSGTSQVPSLTETQLRILSHGPNFAVVPRCPPVGEYIASIEQACKQLKQGEAEELRGEIKAILKKIKKKTQVKYHQGRTEGTGGAQKG